MRRLVLISIVSFLGCPAMAQVPDLCSSAPNQMAANACASNKFAAADNELNALYGQLAGKLGSDGKRYLKDAELAWISYRDKECVSRTGGGPSQQGTIWPMLYVECQTGLTRSRIEDLKAQIRCPGGDLSCSQ